MSGARVVIIGGGFGGLAAASELTGKAVDVFLIDRRNHHLFQPLLYQVATAGLNPADISMPIRAIFSHAPNIQVHLGEAATIDLGGKSVTSHAGFTLPYDYLILACGARHSYFGKPEWEEFAPGLKTVEQATEIRRRILMAFEQAENELDPEKQKALLTFAVVGGGATGVELAGAIADISRTVLVRDFRRINPASARILLIEAGPRLLATFPPELSARAARDLAHLGVEIQVGARVGSIDADGLEFNGQRVSARSVFWAAGVQAESIGRTLGVPLDRAGRITVANDLSIPGHPDAFVVGDLASFDLGGGKMMPGLAPAAMQSGRAAARNILASLEGKPRVPFRYKDKGQLATIGKRRAIAQTGRLKLGGFIAWLTWLFVHIFYLIGFRNRVAVLAEWTWNYVFSKRGARLITSPNWRQEASGGNVPTQARPLQSLALEHENARNPQDKAGRPLARS